jgi:hypothetical protein
MVTRTASWTLSLVDDPLQLATRASVAAQTVARTGCLTWKRKCMLQEHGGREGIDITLTATGRPTQFADGAKGGSGRIPLVHETHGEARPFLQFRRDVPDLHGAGRFVTVFVERQADDEAFDLELLAPPNHLGDRRPLTATALDEPGRRGNRAGRIADGETDANVAVING